MTVVPARHVYGGVRCIKYISLYVMATPRRLHGESVRIDIQITSQWAVSSTVKVDNKSVYDTYLHPSSHPSPPGPDVLPDAFNSSTLLIKLGLTFKKVC